MCTLTESSLHFLNWTQISRHPPTEWTEIEWEIKFTFRALDKREYLVIIRDNFCSFPIKTYVVSPHLNRLDETVQMRGHNIWIWWEIKKIIIRYSFLSRTLHFYEKDLNDTHLYSKQWYLKIFAYFNAKLLIKWVPYRPYNSTCP